jgi:predicted nucleic acid-binding Zn ribbon protein
MVEKLLTSSNNVINLASYRDRNGGASIAPSRTCRHCGAALHEGEREEECSSAFNVDNARLRWQAAQILRGLI